MTVTQFLRKVLFRLRGRKLTIRAKGNKRGHVLLSHDTTGFFMPKEKLAGHAHYWTACYMAEAFSQRGYEVDVISWENTSFRPRKPYDFFIDIHANMGRLAPLLSERCIKILQCSNAHWLFQNASEYARCLDVQRRRGATIRPQRLLSPARSIEVADCATYFGNAFTCGTYHYAGKPMHCTPIPSAHRFPSPEGKDFTAARKRFVWFGSAGAVHKGLDLVLEAFAEMPEFELTVCGKWYEKDFADAYHHELNDLPHIKALRYVNPKGPEFKSIIESSIAVVYPSCSEGCAGTVVDCMQAGLIPIVSYQTGVNTEDFGITLKENTVGAIRAAVRETAACAPDALKKRAIASWEYARINYSPEAFAAAFDSFIDHLEKNVR